ncbi:Rne/Rng family ribonuclease [Nitratireductor basaltis]|uniref:Ribonuclease E n=1 Tax=Nitratireductor basaltis TaxID=472175 RepID=A0A084UAP8_9HYPH|nr:ribonuclease E/G [Nitratireductor basaltis]KFB10034.1 Ribonuclease E [Nitratireductor basaltis]
MPNKMLIDASHPEETRVVVTRGSRIEEFDFESQDKKQLRGNIYLARVTRVEPSLQAAFVEYGGNRHGFLAFSEIHPDYYQIPVADRQALLEAEAQEAGDADDDGDEPEVSAAKSGRKRRRNSKRSKVADTDKDAVQASEDKEEAKALAENGESVSEDVSSSDGEDTNGSANGDDGEVDTVGAEDAIDEAQNRRRPVRRNYKIQEVIKRRQILLVQVVKEERGNKGAALTTYMSLAGRYSVLMPNTARGGGISRKITNAQDRKRLKEVVKNLEVPQGMGVILRTAGANRTKAEIKRDYDYLMRMWEKVRTLTLESAAPALVYEEGSLIKRSVRDLYNKDIDEILVAGEEGYREAKDFMRMLMPSHAKVVQPYRDTVPIFARNGIEGQLDKMVQPQVTLKSGGYIIINQTEALVAIDVNSGRSTKEHSIEDTALQTNLEAAEEVARQLRLRDLAGLIVIDFIDMEENRNNRAVEKKLKECLKNDRARIQVGRISHFGLLEMSRQRIRASVLESTMQPCPTCGGTGHVRSESSVALLVVRAIEEYLLKDARNNISVHTPASTALYLLNHKRQNLVELEERFGVTITIEADEKIGGQHYQIVKGEASAREGTVTADAIEAQLREVEPEPEEVAEASVESDNAQVDGGENGNGSGRKRRRKRRRRGGRDRNNSPDQQNQQDQASASSDNDGANAETEDASAEGENEKSASDDGGAPERKKRHRGRRGGRRNRKDDQSADENGVEAESESSQIDGEAAAASAEGEAVSETGVEDAAPATDTGSEQSTESSAGAEEKPEEPVKKPRRRSRTRKTAVAETSPEAQPDPADDGAVGAASDAVVADPKPEAEVVTKAVETPSETVAEPGEAEPEERSDETVSADNGDSSPSRDKEDQKTPEPVVSSSTDSAPRKTGWWQRKSFF